jgi:hypothetical protein
MSRQPPAMGSGITGVIPLASHVACATNPIGVSKTTVFATVSVIAHSAIRVVTATADSEAARGPKRRRKRGRVHSPKVRRYTVSGHLIHMDQPQALVDAIQTVVDAVRDPRTWESPAATPAP